MAIRARKMEGVQVETNNEAITIYGPDGTRWEFEAWLSRSASGDPA